MNAPVSAPMRKQTKRMKKRQMSHMSADQLEKKIRMCKQTIAKYSAELTWAQEELNRREHRSHAAQATDSDD